MTPESELDRLFKRMAPDDYKPVPDALAPVQFANTVFNPRRQSEAAAARGALADGDFYSDGE